MAVPKTAALPLGYTPPVNEPTIVGHSRLICNNPLRIATKEKIHYERKIFPFGTLLDIANKLLKRTSRELRSTKLAAQFSGGPSKISFYSNYHQLTHYFLIFFKEEVEILNDFRGGEILLGKLLGFFGYHSCLFIMLFCPLQNVKQIVGYRKIMLIGL